MGLSETWKYFSQDNKAEKLGVGYRFNVLAYCVLEPEVYEWSDN